MMIAKDTIDVTDAGMIWYVAERSGIYSSIGIFVLDSGVIRPVINVYKSFIQ